MKKVTLKKKKPLKVVWHKTKFAEEASYGSAWGKVCYTWDLDDNKVGYAFFNSNNEIVTPKFKTRPQARKAAEKWLKENYMNTLMDQLAEAKEKKDEGLVRIILDQIAYMHNLKIERPNEKGIIFFGKPAKARSYYVPPMVEPVEKVSKRYRARKPEVGGSKRQALLAKFKKKD